MFGLGAGAATVYLSGPDLDPGAMLFGRTMAMEMDLGANLGIDYRIIPIDPIFQAFLDGLAEVFEGTETDVSEENIQARIRGGVLMALSNKFGRLLLTTGNKSEVAVGYATLYGDMAGGLAVI